MIYNITEQTFESHNSSKQIEKTPSNEILKLLVKDYDKVDYDIKARFAEKNNIFKEINTIKEYEHSQNVDYISVLRISGILLLI